MSQLFHFVTSLAPALIYLLLGAGAAVENVIPPIPADTFVLLGGFLAALDRVDAWWVFLATWGANVGSALVVYGLGHRYGRPFFEQGWGQHLLNERQFARMRGFFDRWGFFAIFFTRFLPGFRAVVPVFAGVTHQPFVPVAVPLVAASALWYGGLVWVGATTGRNLDALLAWLEGVNRGLLAVAVVVALVLGVWWWRTRHGARRSREDD